MNSTQRTKPKFVTRFAKIHEFPHRVHMTQYHPFLDVDADFNYLARQITQKQDTVFIAYENRVEVLIGCNCVQQVIKKISGPALEISISGKNDLLCATLYIYLHRRYEQLVLNDCAFQRVLVFAKRLDRIILENTTIIFLNVHHCKELEQIQLQDNSAIVADNLKTRPGVTIVNAHPSERERYYPFVDEIEEHEMLSSDFASSDSLG